MIYFLYGENSFLIAEKLVQIKENFAKKYGDTNITQFQAKDLEYEKVNQATQSMPLLASKKLVILKNVFSEGSKTLQGQLADFLANVPKDTILIFSEPSVPDKRSSLFKRLIKLSKSKEFTNLAPNAALSWIKRRVENMGGQIDESSAELLNLYVGADLWRLSNEIEKLLSYDKKISCEGVKKLVSAQITGDIFTMLDGIGEKNAAKAAKMLQNLVDLGQSEHYIFSMFVYQVRNMLIVKDLAGKKLSAFQIAQKARLHPYVVQKTLLQVKNFELEKIKKIYEKISEADYSIKTGQIQPRIAMDLLLVGLCH